MPYKPPAGSLAERTHLTQREAATYWKVHERTVARWIETELAQFFPVFTVSPVTIALELAAALAVGEQRHAFLAGAAVLLLRGLHAEPEGREQAEISFLLVDPGFFDTYKLTALDGRLYSPKLDKIEDEVIADSYGDLGLLSSLRFEGEKQ